MIVSFFKKHLMPSDSSFPFEMFASNEFAKMLIVTSFPLICEVNFVS